MRMTLPEWRTIVKDMQQRGATGTDADMQAVVAYLGKYLTRN